MRFSSSGASTGVTWPPTAASGGGRCTMTRAVNVRRRGLRRSAIRIESVGPQRGAESCGRGCSSSAVMPFAAPGPSGSSMCSARNRWRGTPVDDDHGGVVRGRRHRQPPDVRVVRVQGRRDDGAVAAQVLERDASRVRLDTRRPQARVAGASGRPRDTEGNRRGKPGAGVGSAVEELQGPAEEVLRPRAVLRREPEARRERDRQQGRLAEPVLVALVPAGEAQAAVPVEVAAMVQ